MGFIFKIIVGVFIMFFFRSWVTDRTLERLPEEMPTSIPEISLPTIKNQQENGKKNDQTDRIIIPNASHKSMATSCTKVQSAFGQSFITDGMSLDGLDSPRAWVIENLSTKTIAIILGQNEIKFAVAYIPPNSRYAAKIPSTKTSFIIKTSDIDCINHKTAGGFEMNDPGYSGNTASNRNFKTIIKDDGTESISFNNAFFQ